MKLFLVSRELMINLDQVTHIEFWIDPEDGDLRKARVFLIGRTEPIDLIAGHTRALELEIERVGGAPPRLERMEKARQWRGGDAS